MIPTPCSSDKWQKFGVILEPDESGPHGTISNFTCSVEPVDESAWRLWFCSTVAPAKQECYRLGYAIGIPGQPMRKVYASLSESDPLDDELSIGNLPAGWRPRQPIHLNLKNGTHRLYFWVHGPEGVARYLAANSENGRKYKVIDPYKPCLYHYIDRAVESEDKFQLLGLTPSQRKEHIAQRPKFEQAAPDNMATNDATMVYQLEDGSFELYTAAIRLVGKDDPRYIAHDNAPGAIRVIDRFTSSDGIVWGNRKRVIECDSDDATDMQFYHLSVTRTPDGLIGMLGHYPCIAQTMDIEWCFSRDGIWWERPSRKPWIYRAEKNAPDCHGIYPPHRLVFHQNKWWLFYTGTNTLHNQKESAGTPRTVVMLATCDSILKK